MFYFIAYFLFSYLEASSLLEVINCQPTFLNLGGHRVLCFTENSSPWGIVLAEWL